MRVKTLHCSDGDGHCFPLAQCVLQLFKKAVPPSSLFSLLAGSRSKSEFGGGRMLNLSL